MTAMESFENIMCRNNTTTLPDAHKTGARNRDLAAATNFSWTLRTNAVLLAIFAVLLCLCLLSPMASAASVHRRDVASANETLPPGTKHCHQNTPCGWAIYIPFTRRIDYFMKNTCECPSNLACLKTDDDLSVNAYVYRCKNRPPSTTTEASSVDDAESTMTVN
ncbi:uncharacterized protein LOC112689593 [Sipha flava]|uniref:Uncharacterized protein LOC112689593 n=1 Tax=Sipha flava TaxID=143950 RepID=A0A2S2QDF7_9HEMI|nr:uncharacterized protein LOC112689593 [Sipha flava]